VLEDGKVLAKGSPEELKWKLDELNEKLKLNEDEE